MPTMTSLSSSANPSVTGQPLTYAASMTSSGGTPTGTVAFTENATTIANCGAQPLTSGRATCTVVYTGPGAHSISAVYSGDSNFATSISTLVQTVNQAATTTAVRPSANPLATGEPVIYTATITVSSPGSGSPSGTVTFNDGGNAISACTAEALTSSTLMCGVTYASVGSHTVTAVYSGDSNFLASSTTAALTEVVNQATTSTTISSSANPSAAGQAVTYTATIAVAAPGTGDPTGTVAFTDGNTTISGCGSSPVSAVGQGGTATCTVTYPTVGSHMITLAYSGDANYLASTSAKFTQTVNDATVVIYGQQGTFGGLQPAGFLPNGQSYQTINTSLALDPGQAAWFATGANNGDIVIPNQPQSDNPLGAPTANDMAVTIFTPSTAAVQTVRIKTSTGYTYVPPQNQGIGGADIEDSLLLPNGQVALDSASPWNANPFNLNPATYGVYPTYVTLQSSGNGWAPSTAKFARDIQSSNTQPAPTPLNPNLHITVGQQACPTGSMNGVSITTCLSPAEMGLLPQSGDVVVAQYTPNPTYPSDVNGEHSGHLMVLDPAGKLLASYVVANQSDSTCTGSNGFKTVSPREIDTDPTSVLGDERFIVIYDVFCNTGTTTANSWAAQEFSFNSTRAQTAPTQAITATSAAFNPSTTSTVDRAHYDRWGNLWFGTKSGSNSLAGADVAVYTKAADDSHKFNTTACPPFAAWGEVCPPDYPSTENELHEGTQMAAPANIQEVWDPTSGTSTEYIYDTSDYVLPITATYTKGQPSTMTFTMRPIIDQGIHSSLNPGQGDLLNAVKGAISGGYLWIPVQQWLTPGTAPPTPPIQLSQYLTRISLANASSPPATTIGTTPVTIQAEDFNGYSRGPPGQQVFVFPSLDTGHSMDVGLLPSNYTTYSVIVASSGSHTITYRLADGNTTSGQLQLTAAGVSLSTTTILPTGRWASYQSVASASFTLSQGVTSLTVTVTGGTNLNLNYFTIS
jgi:hypothetical protein